MEENVIILPGNEAELVELYLDKTKHDALTDNSPDSSRQAFIEAMKSFAEKLCAEQRAICSHRFMIAPNGDEEVWIERAPMPCVYDRSRYETLHCFMSSLNVDEMTGLMETFPDIFGGGDTREALEDYTARMNMAPEEGEPDERDTIINFCIERWYEIQVEDKLRVYRHYVAGTKA